MAEPDVEQRIQTKSGTRVAMVISGLGAAFVLMGGAAFGCIPWKGEMQVKTPPGQRNVTVHGDPGDGLVMTQEDNQKWCAVTEPYKPGVLQASDTFEVKVRPFEGAAGDGQVCQPSALPDGTYDVTFEGDDFTQKNGDGAFQTNGTDELDWGCHHNSIGEYDAHLGTFQVTAGSGEGVFTMPSSTPSEYKDGTQEAGAICVTHNTSDLDGNMAPVVPSL